MRRRHYDETMLLSVPDRFNEEYWNTPIEDRSEWVIIVTASFLFYLEEKGYRVDSSMYRWMCDYAMGKNYLMSDVLGFDLIEEQIPDYIVGYNYVIRNIFYNGVSMVIHF